MTSAERADRAWERLRVAQEVLGELDLLRRWSRYGEVVVVGSVGLELVVAPDIDLEIWSDEPRVADGFAVLGALAELARVRRITYLDARDRHERGQYWKLEYERMPDETWTVDMWVFAHGSGVTAGAGLTAELRDKLTRQDRDAILAVKEEAAELGERAPGYWLYQAVVDGGVQTYDGFRSWLGDQNIYERTDWLPHRS